jgi:hypothetical protein
LSTIVQALPPFSFPPMRNVAARLYHHQVPIAIFRPDGSAN